MSAQQKFDIIIAGGGIAGLTLAHLLTEQSNSKKISILIIDHGIEIEFANVSFWAKSPPIAGMPLIGSWRQFEVVFSTFKRTLPLHDYTFHSFNRADYLEFLKKELINKKVVFRTESIASMTEAKNRVEVGTKSGKTFTAPWVFDSTHLGESKSRTVPVHGWTWEIETSKPIFTPKTMTLFDFEATKLPDSFLYMLPLSATTAIIEFSSFNETPSIGACEYWLTNRLRGIDYKMVRLNQKGVSSYQVNINQKSSRIIPIGLKAGIMNSCSGFAYMNIVRHCQYLAADFPNYSSNTHQKRKWYQSVFDHAFKLLFSRAPRVGVRMLPQIFKYSQGDVILAYLEGALSLKQILYLPIREIKPEDFI